MTNVRVEASKRYDILIGRGLLENSGKHVRSAAGGEKAAVITDDVVDRLYAHTVVKSLQAEGMKTSRFVISHGEKSKNAVNFIAMLNFLAENGFTRKDTVIALGGGVVGDIAGFAAATYMRGINLVQIPTTLLSAVDSSVGGKTAIDLDTGKNLAGAFYQPGLVICDYSTLDTLSGELISAGCAEIIKYGVIADSELFSMLKQPVQENYEEIIARCVSIKRDIVCEDERDEGKRNILNFGHTIGHAVELCSGYEIPHGFAVAAGMAAMARASFKLGLCTKACRDGIIDMIRLHGLPAEVKFGAEELFKAALSDKKGGGGTITIIVPREIGRSELRQVTMAELKEIIALGIAEQGGA